jgi:hypothetical protein
VISKHENDEWISFCNWFPFFFTWLLTDIIIIGIRLYFLNLYMLFVILNFDKGRKGTNYDMTVDLLKSFLNVLYVSLFHFVLWRKSYRM